jgi:lipopolysaccharide biosynthesis glycosyltransferase
MQPLRPEAVTVVSCGDDNFTAPAGVLFRSIMDHAQPGRFYDLIYLHNGADPLLLEQLCAMADGFDNISIRVCDIRPVFSSEGLYVDNRNDFSPMTFARLVIPDVLSREYRRALYLDGDMIAFRDVSRLFDSDLQGKPLASSVDFGFLSEVFASSRLQRYVKEVIGLERPDDYFMAAVLLMDLDAVRRVFPAGSLMETARSRRWTWHDQDVLNHLFRGQIRYLEPAWDVILPDKGPGHMPPAWRKIYETAFSAPYLFHFAGNHAKPWTSCHCCYGTEFWEIARRTPFYSHLLSRLRNQKSSYERLYGTPGRNPLRKILPPPAKSVHRDLKTALDRMDEVSRSTLMLMRQLPRPPVPACPAAETPFPIAPVWQNAVPLVCCGDEAYAAPTGVLFQSVIDQADPERFYDIIYLHNGISRYSKERLCALADGHPNISVRTCDIRAALTEPKLYTENREGFSHMAYARLIIPEILGGEYRRSLYLDGDMLAYRDIAPLYDTDLEGKPLGATLDAFFLAQANRRNADDRQRLAYWRQVSGISKPEDYSMSAVLLMDLDRFRREKLPQKLMQAALSRPWQYHDQDVLNYVLHGQIQALDMAWNSCHIGELAPCLPEKMRIDRKAFIFHFAGGGAKPWERTCPPHGEDFWKAAAKTGFYGELLRRLHRDLDTYHLRYQEGGNTTMLKRFLKKILPPPVESVQRDLKTVLDALDEQKRLNLLLMQQIDELRSQSTGEAAAPDAHIIPAKSPNHKLRFEFALAAHCNLNCAGCSHFSPLAQEEFPDFEESKRSFAHLSRLFDGECEYIHLLGGEPLLNPQCADFLQLARSCFPKGDILLVTNGLLLPKMPDSFYETCRQQRITVAVTPYPIPLDLDAIGRRCADFGVAFTQFGEDTCKDHFNRLLLDPAGSGDPAENYRSCPYSNICLFLYRGRMYPCGIGAHFRIFEKHFSAGLELSDDDSVDIFSVQSGSQLLYRLAKPRPMCRYCRVEHWQEKTPWKHSNQKMDEWVSAD